MREKLYLPWKIFVGYIIITLFLNIFGPWKYENKNNFFIVIYVVSFLIVSTFFYKLGIKTKITIHAKREPLKLIKLSLIYANSICIYAIFENIQKREFIYNSGDLILTMAKVYSLKNKIPFTYSRWLMNYTYIFILIGLIGGVYFFKKLNLKFKFLTIFLYIIYIFYTIVFIGAQKNLGDIFIYLLSIFFIKTSLNDKKMNKKQRLLLLVFLLFIALVFMKILSTRLALWGIKPDYGFELAYVDYENFLIKYLDNSSKIGLIMLIFYLSSGYYGLSLALQQPLLWSMGLGSSFEIKETIKRSFHLDKLPLNYPEKVEQVIGWKAYANWQTIFPWLASDFTFIGAIIFLSVIMFFYARIYKSILIYQDFNSIVFFCYLNIMLVYIPANNQIFQTRSSIIVLIILLSYNILINVTNFVKK